MIVAIILALIALIVNFFVLLFLIACLIPLLRGAPYVPIQEYKAKRAMELVSLGPGKKIADLGSGDGRVLIAAAKRGAIAYGYEINPFLVSRTRALVKKEGLSDLVFCCWKSFWRPNYKDCDVVFIFGITYIMRALEKKLRKELKPGAKVVSFVFTFTDWRPVDQEDGIYIYQK